MMAKRRLSSWEMADGFPVDVEGDQHVKPRRDVAEIGEITFGT
jgi:hypothetical protein